MSPSTDDLGSNSTESPDSPVQSYVDNWIDRLFIKLFSDKMARALGQQSRLKGYDGFVDLSKQIMQDRTPPEQQEVVAHVLSSLVPGPILAGIRFFFEPTQWVCESNAWFATRLFQWLVGPCEQQEAIITEPSGQQTVQLSRVHIKKCRYLEHAGCVGMCINMCKLPTQTFFANGFGIPLTMVPNFEDLSCEMTFGQAPDPAAEEVLMQQPCLVSLCPHSAPSAPVCPSIQSSSSELD